MTNEMRYRDSFEDALELCLAEVANAETKNKATAKLEEWLGLVKEDKLERLKQMLWLIKK